MTEVKFDILADGADDAAKDFKNLGKAGEEAAKGLKGLDKLDFPDPPAELVKGIRDVQAASADLLKSRGREADAAGQLRVAELKLEEVRNSGKATGSQIAAAEEKVASALRKTEEAASQTSRAMDELETAQRNAARIKDLTATVKIDADGRPALSEIEKVEKAGKGIKDAEIKVDVDEEKVAGAKEKLGELGNLGAGIGDKFGAGFSAGVLGAVASGDIAGAVSEAISGAIEEFQSRIDARRLIQSQLGITKDAAIQAFEDVRAAQVAFGTGLKASNEELAETYGVVRRSVKDWASLSTTEQGKLVTDTQRLAETYKVDVVQSVSAAGSVVNNFGGKWSDAVKLISDGYKEMGAKGDDWADTLNEYPQYFQQLGLSAKDMFTVVKQGLDAGAQNTDKVADAFKELGIRVVDGSKQSSDALRALGLDAVEVPKAIAAGGDKARAATDLVIDRLRDMSDPIEQNRIGVMLFGTQWEDTMRKGISNTDIASGSLGDLTGLFDKAGGASLRLSLAMSELRSHVDALINADLGYRSAVDATSDAQTAAADALKQHGKKSEEYADAVRGVESAMINQAKAARDKAVADAEARGAADSSAQGERAYTNEILQMAQAAGNNAPIALRQMISGLTDTQLTALGAQRSIDGAGNAVYRLPNGKTMTVSAQDDASWRAARIQAQLDSIPPLKVITVQVREQIVAPSGSFGYYTTTGNNPYSAGRHAKGGWVRGPGTTTSDSVPIMASDKEFVVKASMAAKYGPELEAINSGRGLRVADGAMRSLAPASSGGPVGVQVGFSVSGIDGPFSRLVADVLRKGLRVSGKNGNVQAYLS